MRVARNITFVNKLRDHKMHALFTSEYFLFVPQIALTSSFTVAATCTTVFNITR